MLARHKIKKKKDLAVRGGNIGTTISSAPFSLSADRSSGEFRSCGEFRDSTGSTRTSLTSSQTSMSRSNSNGKSQPGSTRSLRSSTGSLPHFARQNTTLTERQAKYDEFVSQKLRFDKLGKDFLFGREKEKNILVKALEISVSSATESSCQRQLILIQGESGSGKTALVTYLKKLVNRKHATEGAFVMGKFTKESKHGAGVRPYSAVVDACSQLCNILKPSGQASDKMKGIREKIAKETSKLGPVNVNALKELIPELAKIIDLEEVSGKGDNPEGVLLNTPNVDELQESTVGPLPRSRLKHPLRQTSFSSRSSYESKTRKAEEQNSNYILGGEQSQARFFYAFTSFFRIASRAMRPFVMVIDDVQWCDPTSTRIFESIVNDAQNENFFLVFLYRSNEISDNTSFTKFLEKSQQKAQQSNQLRISTLTTCNLTVPDVNEILVEVLNLDIDDDPNSNAADTSERILRFAELCHKRSMGNPFFLITFLRRIFDDKLLQFDFGKYRWKWDYNEVSANTEAMINVVDLMKREMTRLPELLQRRLSVAACLGDAFRSDIFTLLLEEMEQKIDKKDLLSMVTVSEAVKGAFDEDQWSERMGIDSCLPLLRDLGFIVVEQNPQDGEAPWYHFIHDKVREGALGILPPDELNKIKGEVGRTLSTLDLLPSQWNSVLFVAAKLLHQGPPIEDLSERLRLAEINLEAAENSSDLSAFSISAEYAGRGIDLLPPDRWEMHRDLTLRLYNVSAQSEDRSGNADMVYKRYKEVADRNDIQWSEKVDIYGAQIHAVGGILRQQDEAVDLILLILRQQGLKIPKTTFGKSMTLVRQLLKVKKRCQSLTMQDLLEMPELPPAGVDKLKLLHQVSTYSYSSKKNGTILMPLAFITISSITFESGVSMYTPANFATLGLLFAHFMNDIELGGKMSILALRLLEQRPQYSSIHAFTTFSVHQFVRPWLDPIASCRPQWMLGYESGLRSGDTEFAMWNIFSYVVSGFQLGKPLKQLEKDIRIYAAQMAEYNRGAIQMHLSVYWVAMVQLIGNQDRIEPLQGVTEATWTLDEYLEREGDIDHLGLAVSMLKSVTCAYLGDHEIGSQVAFERGDSYAASNPGFFMGMTEVFSRALSFYDMAIKTKKSKYKKPAKRLHAQIKNWRESGNPNVLHYEKALDAEKARLKGEYESARSLYHSAKVIASRSGLVHDAALISERCGEMSLHQDPSNLKGEAALHLGEAISLYTEWGALAKVELIRSKHPDLDL